MQAASFMPVISATVVLAIGLQFAASVSLDKGPQRQIFANVGDTIVFACDLRDVGARRIHWYLEESKLYISVDRVIYRRLDDDLETRLAILGNPDQEQFSLRIQDVRQSDSGNYSCTYAFQGGLSTTVASSSLAVYIPPEPGSPECRVEPNPGGRGSKVGDWVTLRCISTGSPPPLVTYQRGDSEEVLARSVSPLALQWRLTPQDNGMDFTCAMTSPVLDGPRYCSVKPLEIFPRAEVTPAQLMTQEGAGASLICEGFGEPHIASYRWEITDTSTGRELPVSRYRLTHNDPSLDIMSVRENITATCFVTTPSGLSGNATARINMIALSVRLTTASVVQSGQTTDGLTTNSTDAGSTNSSPPTDGTNSRRPIATAVPTRATLTIVSIVAASSGALATLAVITCICCARHRRRRRRPLSSSLRYDKVRRSSGGDIYEDFFSLSPSTKVANTLVQMQPVTNTKTAAQCPLYAVPDKPKRGVPRQLEDDQFLSSSGIPLKDASRKRRRNGVRNRPALKAPAADHAPTDTALYAQPNRSGKTKSRRVTWDLDSNGLDAAKPGESVTLAPGSAYADLDIDSAAGPSATSDPTRGPSVDPVDTIYAQINSPKHTPVDFSAVL